MKTLVLALALGIGGLVSIPAAQAQVWVPPHYGPYGRYIVGHWDYGATYAPHRVWIGGHWGPYGWVAPHWGWTP